MDGHYYISFYLFIFMNLIYLYHYLLASFKDPGIILKNEDGNPNDY